MKERTLKTKLLTVLLTLCMVLSIVPTTAFAAEIDFLPQGVTYLDDLKRTLHKQVNVTANVSVKDSNGAVVETKQVTKSSEEFLEGGVGALQAKLAALQAEIETPYQASGTVTRGDGAGQTIVDHFETASFYTFTPASGDPVKFGTDLDAAKQYFSEHSDATGTFTELLDMHEYQKYNYTYDLTVQENSQPASTITSAAVQNVKFNYQPGDAPQASAKKAGTNQDKYDILFECWEKQEKDANDTMNTVGYWYSDESCYSDGDVRFSTFEKGGRYGYSVKLRAKDGYTFDSNLTNTKNVTLNGASLPFGSWVMVMDDGKTCLIQYGTELRPGQAVEKIDFNARINFNAGDKPSFMTSAVDPFIYLDHERWDANDGSGYGITSSDYWNERYSGKLITEFEAGKSYTYGVYFKISDLGMEEGYRFDKNTKLYINGKEITLTPDQINVDDNGETIWFSNVLTMMPTTVKVIDVVEINNVTVSFKDGDKPVFTGEVSEDAGYALRCECWSLDENTGIVSTEPEWGGDIYTNKITAFETGKTYHYGVYVTAYTADISPDAKLKINGREVEYTRIGDESDTQSFWVETDLTMTPTADGHTHSYGTDWKSDATNHWHECSCGEKSELAAHSFKWVIDKEATATEKGSKHEECTVCDHKKAAVEIPAIGSAPKTGDNSNMFLWVALLFVSGGVLTALGITGKKKRITE